MAVIFGYQINSHFETGFIDSISRMSFAKHLERVKAKWDNLEMSCHLEVPRFHDWFTCSLHKANQASQVFVTTGEAASWLKGTFKVVYNQQQ